MSSNLLARMAHTPSKKILMVAGEASGDLHGSHVAAELLQRDKRVHIYGVGGKAMAAAGVEILIASDQLAVVGITEAISKGSRLLSAIRRIKNFLADHRPDLLLLIDFPDFNLHLAATAKKYDIPVLYYISPQIWAWRAKRIRKIKARVNHMAVILPFEEGFYRKNDVPVTFVGHPLLDTAPDHFPVDSAVDRLEKPVIGLLPGSRDKEVERLLPVMLRAATELYRNVDAISFVVSCAPSVEKKDFMEIINRHATVPISISQEPVMELFQRCTLIVAASGTVTLEAALYGIPMVITYVVSPMSYFLGKLLIKVNYIGLANLIAQRPVVPELIQKDVTPEAIAENVVSLIQNPRRYADTCSALKQIRRKLGSPGASERVARIALEVMEKSDAV